MSVDNVLISPLPTGGGCMLNFHRGTGINPAVGNLLIERAVSTAEPVYQTLYNGAPNSCLLYLDTNAGGPVLPSNVQYLYRFTDNAGSFTSAPISIASAVLVVPNSQTSLILRLLQAGLQNVVLPPAPFPQTRPTITNAMPIGGGYPALPLIVLNQDIYQQETVGIGQQVPVQVGDNTYITPTYMRAMWRCSILSTNPAERDFWKDAIIAIYTSMLQSVFAEIGSNFSHDVQAASYQVQSDANNMIPGFYGADTMLSVTGNANLIIQTFYGIIENIDFTATFPDGVYQQAFVPTVSEG